MTDECTLMQRVILGSQTDDGPIEWETERCYPVPASNRTRLLRRDSDYPTNSDGWKYVPDTGTLTAFDGSKLKRWTKYCWEDLRMYRETK